MADKGGPPSLGSGTALVVVDVQRDFMDAGDSGPAGSLAVPGARALLPLVNRLMAAVAAAGGAVVASQDWHPEVGPPTCIAVRARLPRLQASPCTHALF